MLVESMLMLLMIAVPVTLVVSFGFLGNLSPDEFLNVIDLVCIPASLKLRVRRSDCRRFHFQQIDLLFGPELWCQQAGQFRALDRLRYVIIGFTKGHGCRP